MFAKLARGTVAVVSGIFFIAYICLLLPALVYMPIVGALAFIGEGMTVLGGVACILGMLTVPFSMGASLYFICSNYSAKKYLKVLFFCLLPIIFLLLSLAFMIFMIYLHGLWCD
jgi:hypothetical protein